MVNNSNPLPGENRKSPQPFGVGIVMLQHPISTTTMEKKPHKFSVKSATISRWLRHRHEIKKLNTGVLIGDGLSIVGKKQTWSLFLSVTMSVVRPICAHSKNSIPLNKFYAQK